MKESDLVIIELFDMTGKAVSRISLGNQEPGLHQFSMETAGFNQGLYHCRVITGENSVGKALILLQKKP